MSARCGRWHCAAIWLGTSILMAATGCGGDPGEGAKENPRASAYGSVKFDGNPIPSGSVVFTHPETGNQSVCPIEDGTYENESGDGPVIGKNMVNIIGMDGPDGKSLWSGTWSREVTIEGDSFEEEFEVKQDEVKPYKVTGMDEEAPLY